MATRCGPIEVQQAGHGEPLLIIHGSGGGHDQGMAWAQPLVQQGLRVIAPSRFGYLRTPRPAAASPEAQADAHACLLDALAILLRLLGSDFLFWTAVHATRDGLVRHQLATPPEHVRAEIAALLAAAARR